MDKNNKLMGQVRIKPSHNPQEKAKAKSEIIKWEQLPEQITAQRIADYFHISRRRVYELMDLNPSIGGIPNYRIGNGTRSTRLVDKDDLFKWKEAQKQKQLAKWEHFK